MKITFSISLLTTTLPMILKIHLKSYHPLIPFMMFPMMILLIQLLLLIYNHPNQSHMLSFVDLNDLNKGLLIIMIFIPILHQLPPLFHQVFIIPSHSFFHIINYPLHIEILSCLLVQFLSQSHMLRLLNKIVGLKP